MGDVSAPSTTRPGGRSARVRAAVHHAVEEMVTEVGAEELTIPAVAARAGVHATTVYRRWGSIGELLTAVATQRFAEDGLVVPDTGSLRGDLRRWTEDVARDLADPDVLALVRAAVGAGGDVGACACVADRHTQLAAMLDRERTRGGDAPEVEDVADALLAPLYYRAVFTPSGVDTARASRLVDALLP